MVKRVKGIVEKYNRLPTQARASFWYLISSFLQKGISVLTTPIFTRLLSTEEYGLFGVFNSWLGIITVFVTLRLYYGVYSQGLVKFDDRRDTFSSALIGLTTTLTTVFFLVYWIARTFWNSIFEMTSPMMIAMFISMWAEAVFCFWAARKRVEYDYRKLILITVLVAILKPVLGIVAVSLFSNKVTARVWEIALVELCAYFALFVIQMKRGKVFYSKAVWKYALAFNIPLIPHYLSQTILNSSDRIMIQRMIGAGEAGIYTLAYSISQIMTLFNTALAQTISPWVYKKIKDNKAKDIQNIVYLSIVFVATVNLLLIAFAPEVITVFAPKSYVKAIWVIPPIAMSVFFTHLYNVFADFEFYYEKTSFIAISTAVAAGINIGLNFVFIKTFGFYAAGYTTLASFIIYALMHYAFMKKICRQELKGIEVFSSRRIALYSIAFVISGGVLMFSYNSVIVRYALIVVVLCVAFYKRKALIAHTKELIRLRGKRNL